VLGIPDNSRGCLFDLDGVLTQTARVPAAAWPEMFGIAPADGVVYEDALAELLDER
jgi:beta-phosphoglucomutase-like phosphatase (HAD superfamily)